MSHIHQVIETADTLIVNRAELLHLALLQAPTQMTSEVIALKLEISVKNSTIIDNAFKRMQLQVDSIRLSLVISKLDGPFIRQFKKYPEGQIFHKLRLIKLQLNPNCLMVHIQAQKLSHPKSMKLMSILKVNSDTQKS